MNTQRLKSVFRSVVLSCAAALGLGAWADYAKTNPVTGDTENYTWKFIGTDTWGSVMVINFILNPPRHYWIPFRP